MRCGAVRCGAFLCGREAKPCHQREAKPCRQREAKPCQQREAKPCHQRESKPCHQREEWSDEHCTVSGTKLCLGCHKALRDMSEGLSSQTWLGKNLAPCSAASVGTENNDSTDGEVEVMVNGDRTSNDKHYDMKLVTNPEEACVTF